MTSLKEEINKRILQGDPKHTINRANEEDGEGTARNGGASDVGGAPGSSKAPRACAATQRLQLRKAPHLLAPLPSVLNDFYL